MPFFDIFASRSGATVIITAHAHKSGVSFHIFQDLSNKNKFKKLRPKMTKIASRGSCLNAQDIESSCQRIEASTIFVAMVRKHSRHMPTSSTVLDLLFLVDHDVIKTQRAYTTCDTRPLVTFTVTLHLWPFTFRVCGNCLMVSF